MDELHGAGFLADHLPPFTGAGELAQRWHFESVAAFAAACPTSAPHGAWARECFGTHESSFYSVPQAEARRLAREGWHDGATRVRAIAERVKLDRPSVPQITRWDVAGAVPSVPRYLAGNPLAMRRRQPDSTRRAPVVTLVSNIAARNGTTLDQFERSAAVAAAITDRLEDAGFRVEVLGVYRGCDHTITGHLKDWQAQRQTEIAFIAKRAADPLDLATLAFALGHPALSRRLCFALVQTAKPTRRDRGGMGASIALEQHPERPPGSFFLPLADTYPDDDVAAFDRACRVLREQGCPGIPETP